MRLMTRRALYIIPTAQGLMDSARHVIGCPQTQVTRIQSTFDDVASTILVFDT